MTEDPIVSRMENARPNSESVLIFDTTLRDGETIAGRNDVFRR